MGIECVRRWNVEYWSLKFGEAQVILLFSCQIFSSLFIAVIFHITFSSTGNIGHTIAVINTHFVYQKHKQNYLSIVLWPTRIITKRAVYGQRKSMG